MMRKSLLLAFVCLVHLSNPVQAASPENWKAHLMRGESYRQQGNFPAALRSYEQALVLNPNAWEVHLSRARTYEKMGMHKRVRDNFDQAVALHPRSEKIWVEQVSYLFRQGQRAQALYAIDEGLRYIPNSAQLRYTRALIALQSQDCQKAMPDLEIAVQSQPHFLPAHQQISLCHWRSQNWPAYTQTLGVMIQASPGRADYHLARAQALLLQQQGREAMSDLDRSLALNPQLPEASWLRGQLYLVQGACAQAIKDFRQACQGGKKEACFKTAPCQVPVPVKPKATPAPSASPTQAVSR